ncbi:type II secretion system F family protein [Pelomonas sp. APW6]|uniref:Type II secretion system F family protein n=1 Tax=Roseateles subflavus TaxID=3053353 RepID=A0ABT7LER1_9BURK|nr:type II secretion system F family protein [Pelomonas sp. APW6]MDL5031328.1 type II secretion system F family protein [Pelomonas sp. APW6]
MTSQLVLVGLMLFGATAVLLLLARRALLSWQTRFTETAKVSLEDMFVFIDPGSLFKLNLALFVLLPLLLWVFTGSPVLAVLGGLSGAILPRASWIILRRRRMALLVEQLPDGLTMMAGAMRAGASLQIALDLVVKESPAPLSQEFSVLLREQRLGLALEDSLRGLSQRLKQEDIDLFVSALTIAKEVGGNLSEILERLSATLRAKAVMEGKIKALTSQGKLQGIVVGMLPILLAGVLYAMDPRAMTPLFTTIYGWGTMSVIFILITMGAFFIKKIVTIDV